MLQKSKKGAGVSGCSPLLYTKSQERIDDFDDACPVTITCAAT
jgi:hypothetical protein